MKYNEQQVLQEALNYILSTYGQHYAGENDDVQLVDLWRSNGTLTTTAIDTATKYLVRFGKKDGFNKKDLLKAIHYIVLAYNNEFLADQNQPNLLIESPYGPPVDEEEDFLEEHPDPRRPGDPDDDESGAIEIRPVNIIDILQQIMAQRVNDQ